MCDRLEFRQRISRTEAKIEHFDFPFPDDDGKHVWNYPGSIALQYEALAVERALKAGAIEAKEWTHADSILAHNVIERFNRDINAKRQGDNACADTLRFDVAHGPTDGTASCAAARAAGAPKPALVL